LINFLDLHRIFVKNGKQPFGCFSKELLKSGKSANLYEERNSKLKKNSACNCLQKSSVNKKEFVVKLLPVRIKKFK
jgi:hypothetical protein